jgi:membrane protease YdiL (CAAX protease family)
VRVAACGAGPTSYCSFRSSQRFPRHVSPLALYKTRMSIPLPGSAVTCSLELHPSTTATKRQRWFEVSLVMLVAFAGSILGSIYVLKNIPGSNLQLTAPRLILGVVQEITGLLLLGYVLSRTGRRFRDIGLHWSLRDAGTGFFVAVASYMAYAIGYYALHAIHLAIYGTPIHETPAAQIFRHMGFTAIPFILINPFFEELIVRAYLMTELIDLTGSGALAIAVSVALQFSYHLYYGWWIALSLAFQFLVFALFFAASRRALPIVVAHSLFDLYALLRLW